MHRSDFLKRVIAITGLGTFSLQALIPKQKIFLQQFFVAGFRFYKGMELLPYMQVNDLLELRREPDNEHDEFAIALYWQQEKIGYMPAGINEMTARLIDANALPLLGMITHLNKEVKPWESVSAAIYILRDKNTDIPVYAPYLTKPDEPVYSTLANRKEEDLYDEIFENSNRIVDVDTISNPDIRAHFKKYYTGKKHWVMYKNKPYAHVYTDDIYSYMYEVNPLEKVVADDGKKYILFNFEGN